METQNKILQETKNIFEQIKTDEKSLLFSEEKLNIKLLKKVKRLKCSHDKNLLNLINLAENNIEPFYENNENIVPNRLDYVKKKENEIDLRYIA